METREKLNIPIRSDIIGLLAELLISKNNSISFKDYYQIEKLLDLVNFENYSGEINRTPIKNVY